MKCWTRRRNENKRFTTLHQESITSVSMFSWKRLRDGWIPVKIRNVFSFITIVSQLLFHLLFSFIILSQEKKENKWKEVWWRDRDGFLDRASFSFSWKRFQPTARSSLRLIVMCCRLKPKRRNDYHGQESMIHVLTSSFSFCWPFNQPQADGQQ